MNHLSINAYSIPHIWNSTMTRKQLKETLLATDGEIFACGSKYYIKSKNLGAGVYKVWLKEDKD